MLRLVPGWHTYWENPGDAGVAPELKFDLPAGSTVSAIDWPAPERVAEGPLTTFSYKGDVLLPVRLTPGETPLVITAHASWLVCRDICVPEEADFTLALPRGEPAASAQSAFFAEAANRTPIPAPFRASISPDGTLSLKGPFPFGQVRRAVFFPSGDGQTEANGEQLPSRVQDGLALRLNLGPSFDPHKPLDGVIRFTDAAGSSHVFSLSATPAPNATLLPEQSSLLLLVAALGGGLLLNLMPCVFPVLAMKTMAIARISGADRRSVRIEAASYTAGVVASFTALGAAFLAFRGAGEATGWGFQFQSPLFVTATAWVLFATGLNMSGVFSVGERLVGTGQALASKGGHLGSFFTGVLAVVVATPCTASFMGAAIAGALTAPRGLALSIFAMMGLGLALPYALIAVLPRLAALLPRPGRWMVTLRQALAFPMYAAAAWLVWVVSQQTGPAGVLSAGAGLVGVGFAAWVCGLAETSTGRRRNVGYAAALATALATVSLLWIGTGASAEPSEPFSQARLAQLQAEGRPVFVNMTAAWCLSCLVNERLALSPAAVRTAFAQAHVAYLKGDWTRQDPAISTFLRDHDRDGVPLYVFYPPGRAPVTLPQLLSEGTVLDQVAKLGS